MIAAAEFKRSTNVCLWVFCSKQLKISWSLYLAESLALYRFCLQRFQQLGVVSLAQELGYYKAEWEKGQQSSGATLCPVTLATGGDVFSLPACLTVIQVLNIHGIRWVVYCTNLLKLIYSYKRAKVIASQLHSGRMKLTFKRHIAKPDTEQKQSECFLKIFVPILSSYKSLEITDNSLHPSITLDYQ